MGWGDAALARERDLSGRGSSEGEFFQRLLNVSHGKVLERRKKMETS